jgi:uncharacterized protein YcfJ
MKLKLRETLALSLLSLSVATPALADHQYQDQARVLSVTPQMERVNNPVQECRTEYVRETVYENRSRSNTGAIVGGVTGGLLGSTIGKGNGKVVAAVLGAGVGAVVGDRVDNDRRYDNRQNSRVVTRPVESCVAVDRWSNVTTGFVVDYEYNGRRYSTVTQQDPGRFIPVNVEVRPGGYVTQVNYSQGVMRGDRDDRDDRNDRNYRNDRGYRDHDYNDRNNDKQRRYW